MLHELTEAELVTAATACGALIGGTWSGAAEANLGRVFDPKSVPASVRKVWGSNQWPLPCEGGNFTPVAREILLASSPVFPASLNE